MTLSTAQHVPLGRYELATETKVTGATYTPKVLADFVAQQIVSNAQIDDSRPLHVLDPAVGDGELLLALVRAIRWKSQVHLHVHGFETDARAVAVAARRLSDAHPDVVLSLKQSDFLEHVLDAPRRGRTGSLFGGADPLEYDLVIANPPYVRTQILGAVQAKRLAESFGLSGRVDLYYAFLAALGDVLRPGGVAGVIVSNRVMTTKAGAPVRAALRANHRLLSLYDFGDTKLFAAAVLPAVLVFAANGPQSGHAPAFTSIYETEDPAESDALDAIEALQRHGVVRLADGRSFRVQHGVLDDSGPADAIWRNATAGGDAWLATVQAHSWGAFRDIGRIRVGVKTCADKVFIRTDWGDMPEDVRPELLRPLTTHHEARRFRAMQAKKTRQILYPHESGEQGDRRAVRLDAFPKSAAYLETHRDALTARTYVVDAGRAWYEIWVSHDPAGWRLPKLVFRDIAEKPTFWLDLDGTVVNGDCYWVCAETERAVDLLWLASAVANSTFAEAFYDHCFNNKLYSGRRRYITQYVEKFPLPDPSSPIARDIVAKARMVYDAVGTPYADALEVELNALVWCAFGLSFEESAR